MGGRMRGSAGRRLKIEGRVCRAGRRGTRAPERRVSSSLSVKTRPQPSVSRYLTVKASYTGAVTVTSSGGSSSVEPRRRSAGDRAARNDSARPIWRPADAVDARRAEALAEPFEGVVFGGMASPTFARAAWSVAGGVREQATTAGHLSFAPEVGRKARGQIVGFDDACR